MAEPEKGDKVFHDGHEDFIINGTVTIKRSDWPEAIDFAQFENERFRVDCKTRELRWSPTRKAWFLPGRVFPRPVRQEQARQGLDPLEVEAEHMGVPHG